MGIFDKIKAFFNPSPEQKADKFLDRITNMYGQSQDRQYYLYQLRDLGGELAAIRLIKRFIYTCENSTLDAEEKELTSDLLVSLGEDAIGPLKSHLTYNDKDFNWPYRTLSQLIEKDALIEFLIGLLNDIGPEYVRDPDRKEQLMLIAKSFENEELTQAVLPYLGDANETIRFVASDAIIAHPYPFALEALSKRLVEEESHRVVTHIAEAFEKEGWEVKPIADREALIEKLPQGMTLNKKNIILKQ